MTEKEKRRDRVARDVLHLSRNTLLVNLRFLDMALSQFDFQPVDEPALLTDGKTIFYHAGHILQCYKSEKERPVRDYLHIVLHCIFRHMYMDPSLMRPYWDLACDIAVENVINDLGLSSAAAARETQQRKYLENIRQQITQPTAEKIYHYLRESMPDPAQAEAVRRLFFADDHRIWYMTDEETKKELGLSGQNGESQDQNDQSGGSDNRSENQDQSPDSQNSPQNKSKRSESQNGNQGSSPVDRNDAEESGQASPRRAQAQIWAEISQRMQTDLETFGKQRGYGAGGLTQNLQAVNREKYDYTAFLKKFAVMGEAMKINDDEFDYIFYTYGLQLYKKMPLIEPLEYKEVKRIREFVIAIDTSGSTSGELVQKFIQKTYNILKSTESFFSKINLHIIQCDAELQEDKKITTQEEFDQYLETMEIHGLGGTDFRPVFSYVEQLRKEKEFTNLKGLIYFTDGFGVFPERKPDYNTAFVYVDDEYNNPEVPPWAIKLVLQRDEI